MPETLTPLQARLFAEIDKRLETLILSIPSGTARNMVCDANIELSTALNVLKGKHEQPAGAPTPMSQLTAPHCQCEACVGGLIRASDCAVHNAPALPKGPCDCGKLR